MGLTIKRKARAIGENPDKGNVSPETLAARAKLARVMNKAKSEKGSAVESHHQSFERRIHQELNEDQFKEMETLMAQGESFREIAVVLQAKWGKFTDIANDRLRQRLSDHYKRSVEPYLDNNLKSIEAKEDEYARNPDLLDQAFHAAKLPDAMLSIDMRLTKARSHKDVLDEMDKVLWVQAQRLNTALQTEKSSPLPLESVSKEMRLYYDMLHKAAQLQSSVGVIRVIGKKERTNLAKPRKDMPERDRLEQQQVEQAEFISAAHKLFSLVDADYEDLTDDAE